MTTETQTPEDWVLIETAKRCDMFTKHSDALRYRYTGDSCFRALCDMIAKHEKPPVCRKVLCAQEALREWSEMGYEGEECMIGVRTIELWEEGFGK